MCTMRVCMLQGWFYDNKCIHPTRVTSIISNPQYMEGIMHFDGVMFAETLEQLSMNILLMQYCW